MKKFNYKFIFQGIKRNPTVTIIIFVTLAIFIPLFYMVLDENIELDKANFNLGKLKERVASLNSTRPYPSENSIEKILKDTERVNFETYLVSEIFGDVYAKPLMAFVKVLNDSDKTNLRRIINSSGIEDKVKEESQKKLNDMQSIYDEMMVYEFIETWKKYIEHEKQSKRMLTISEIFNNFKRYEPYPPEVFIKAREAFLKEMQNNTYEPLNNETIDDYILASLGIPLDFSRIRCVNIVSNIEAGINNNLSEKRVRLPGNKITLFTEFTSVPNDEDIPYIINYCRFLEDLYKRIGDSNIQTIESYKKLNGIKGSESGNFLTFRYQIDMVSSLSSVRKFLNMLQESYKDNRTYTVKSVKFSVVEDSVANLMPYDPKLGISGDNVNILIGMSDRIYASIIIDYAIYIRKIF